MRKGNVLYLNVTSVIGEYLQFTHRLGVKQEFTNARQLKGAMDGYDYLLGDEKAMGIDGQLVWWTKFDIRKLEERGSDLSRFITD